MAWHLNGLRNPGSFFPVAPLFVKLNSTKQKFDATNLKQKRGLSLEYVGSLRVPVSGRARGLNIVTKLCPFRVFSSVDGLSNSSLHTTGRMVAGS